MEMAAFISQADRPLKPPDWDGTGCPFQLNGLCDVHLIRPFGCRVFFCDETSMQWQSDQYERLHCELKRLHDELNVPYFYVEWRDALAALACA
jgi:Fe-S-cluster containining protein